jgi:ABC-type antimicrobial peptide transport system permease subunit
VDILQLVLGQGMFVAGIGILLGLIGAYAFTTLMTTLLFGISVRDIVTYVFFSLMVLCVALIAMLIPAKRAMGVDPGIVLRHL